MEKEAKNVICIKWGKCYGPEYVNRLYNMVVRNTTYHINFYCFTDNSDGLSESVIVKPLPVMHVEELKYAYQKEAGLCDDELGGLTGQRVLYFDLDVLIIDNIDCLFEYPNDDGFYIINDWNTNGSTVGQATCYSWVVGTLGYIKKYFEGHSEEIYKKFYTASQEYLSSKVIEKYGKLNFWKDSWIKSFRFHCLPTPLIPFLRKIRMAKIPKGAKIIAFHGNPKMIDAKNGIWNEKNPIKKFFYKHLKPVKWVEKYWR